MISSLLRSRSTAGMQFSPLGAPPWRFKPRLSQSPFARFTIAARITAIALTLAVPLNLVIAAVIWHLSEAESQTERNELALHGALGRRGR